MNSNITTLRFKESIQITKVASDEIVFSNGMVWTDYHEQDCCESVYADFGAVKSLLFAKSEFTKITIEGVKDVGIRIGYSEDDFECNYDIIPCYNSQNGYYSNDLDLVIKSAEYNLVIDITECELEQYSM